MKARLLPSLLLAGAAIALAVSRAQAHALLASSIPEANAVLERAPAYVQLVFSESIEPGLSSAEAVNSSGARVDNGDARVDLGDPTRMTLTLRPIPDGIYTVSWKVTSSVDGHVTEGAFPFAVGPVNPAALPAQNAGQVGAHPSPAEVVARWLTYLAAAALVGGKAFVLAVWRPAVAEQQGSREAPPLPQPTWSSLALAALALLLAANLLWLGAQAGQVGGGGWTATLGQVLLTTRFGTLWAARVVFALALGALATRARSDRFRLISALAALGLLLSLSLGSHAATETRPLLPVLTDLIHLMAVSLWVGGLTHFVAGMAAVRRMPPPLRTSLTSALIPRFSRVALLSVVVLAASGLLSGLQRVAAWADLIDTAYGEALLVKVMLAGVMVCFGAVNLLVVTPGMRRGARRPAGEPGLVAFFHTLIRGEVVLGVLAFAAAGLLTSLPPTRSPAQTASWVDSGRVDDLRVRLEVTPGRVGWNTFLVTLTSGGEPVEAVNAVDLGFTPANAGVAASQLSLTPLGDGRYQGEGAYLSLMDRWALRVAVRRDRRFDAILNLTLDLNPSQGTTAWPRYTGAFLMLAAVPIWFLLGSELGRRHGRAVFGALVSLAFLALGSAVLLRPLPKRLPINPVSPSAASIESGRALYQDLCVPCHGVSGKGDGPVGLTLNPRPVDLTVHTIPGVHPDGQLYDWITNGFQGSVMPAWEDRLSDNLRWDLVNYLRTLAPSTAAAGVAAPLAAVPSTTPPTPIPPTTIPVTPPSPQFGPPIYTFETPFPWANLPVHGRLLFLTYDTEATPNLIPVPFLAELDLDSGLVHSVWRPPQDTWLSGMERSPDGTRLAIAYAPQPPPGRVSGYPGLYLLPGECLEQPCPGTLPEPIVEGTETDSYFGPSWSPDGRFLYFTHVTLPPDAGIPVYSIERVVLGEGVPEQVLNRATWPRLSPDGGTLAYVAFDLLDYLNDLYFASPDGSDTRPGMTPGLFISVDAPLFSPDGEYLYFSATGPGPEAAALPPSGNDRTWLDRLLGVQVAYANGMPSEWWRLSLTGDNPAGLKATGDPVRLTAIGASGLSGAFSPDRRLLAFISYGGMGLLDLEGGRVTWIYPATTFGSVIWLP